MQGLLNNMSKRSQINASVASSAKQELEAILAHHYQRGQFRMSMTKILEELIHKEAKRLDLCSGKKESM